MLVRVTVPGDPVAWKRMGGLRLPNGHVVRFEKPAVRSYKAVVQQHVQEALRVAGLHAPAFDGPVRVTIVATWSLPRSRHKKRQAVPASWRRGRPDIDNVSKLVLDACTGLLWNDDDQVAHLVVSKVTAAQGSAASLGFTAEAALPDELPRWGDEEDAC